MQLVGKQVVVTDMLIHLQVAYVCVYVAVPGRIEFIPLHFLTALSHSKRCSTELRLRVGLISAT